MTRIGIIIGSTRPGRFGPQAAKWLHEIAKENKNAEFELIDLEEINLPILDEEAPASMGRYSKDHTKKWASKIGSLDGYIFVTPEYNHSYSASLKNSIDYLFAEWNFKPLALASYGAGAGGARAIEHLRGVAAELKMYDIRETVIIPNYWEKFDESGKFNPGEDLAKTATSMVDQLVFWANEFKEPRKKLQTK